MKKLIAVLLAVTLMAGLLTACSQKEEASKEPKKEITLDETVIIDENDIKVTITGLKEGWLGTDLAVTIENNAEANIALSTDDCVINGITIGSFGYISAPAGETTEGTITIYNTELELAGIDTIATISCPNATIVDDDSFDTLCQAPFDLTTSVGADFEQTIDQSGDVIFEGEGITVSTKFVEDDTDGAGVYLLVQNETGMDIIVEGMDITVNSTDVSAWLYDTVYADTVRFCDLGLFTSDLEDKGIEAVEQVAFSLRFYGEDSYDSITETEIITVTIP